MIRQKNINMINQECGMKSLCFTAKTSPSKPQSILVVVFFDGNLFCSLADSPEVIIVVSGSNVLTNYQNIFEVSFVQQIPQQNSPPSYAPKNVQCKFTILLQNWKNSSMEGFVTVPPSATCIICVIGSIQSIQP